MKYLLIITLLLVTTVVFGQIPEQPVGNGTPENPYQIANFNNLLWIRQAPGNWSLHYLQTANIDASVSTELELGAGWTPIGNTSPFFTGTYDGQGFEIQGLYLSRTTNYYTGLFGYLVGAKLNRINLRGMEIHGFIYAGGLAGVAQSSVINNCSVTGSLTGQIDVGGMIGFANYNSVITNCYSQVSVQGSENVGGMVGQCGFNNSYFYRCFSSGLVSAGAAIYHGGFIGRLNGGGVYYSYWDTQSSGQSSDPMAIPRTTAQMKQRATYENWNFDTQWSIQEGVSSPVLNTLAVWDLPITLTLASLSGSGTETDPYLIENADQFNAIKLDLTAWYRLTTDIDLSATVVWNHGQGWMPVGTLAVPFSGVLDGAGHRLTNLVINLPKSDYSAIFGYTQNATLKNLTIVNGRINGKNFCGSLVGDALGGTIDHISFTGQIYGYDYCGGLAGRMENTLMAHCQTNLSYCSAGGFTGGITGVLSSSGSLNGMISECFSSGEIVAGWHVGGIAGALSWGTINDCFSIANVTGGRNLGGVVGIAGGSNPGYINRCYGAGTVNLLPTGSFEGGVVGYLSDGSAVTSSFWDTDTTGIPNNLQNGGKTHPEMIYPGSQTTFAAWDFITIWRHDTQGSQNGGYPYLAWHELPVPDMVQNLTISSEDNVLLLQWTPQVGIYSYKIYASEDPYLPYSQWSYLGVSNTSEFTTAADDLQFFMVRAVLE